MVAVPFLMLEPQAALLAVATVLFVAAGSAYYGTAIIGGVIGDFLGATIQVTPVLSGKKS
jgi:cobalamin synthase